MGILLTILGVILSIIKFILLFVLFLIVFVLFVVAVLVLAPINYSLDAEYDSTNGTENIRAKVFYSLKFIYVDFGLADKKSRLYVKLFGKRVYDTDKKTQPKKSAKSKNKTKTVKKDNGQEKEIDKTLNKSEDINKVEVKETSEKNQNIENTEFNLEKEIENKKVIIEDLEKLKQEEVEEKIEETNKDIESIGKDVPIDYEEYSKKIEAEMAEELKKEKIELKELEKQKLEEIKEKLEQGNDTSAVDANGNQKIEFALEKELERQKRDLEERERQKEEEVRQKIEEEKEKSKKDPNEPSFIDKVKVWLDIYDNYPEKDKIFEKSKKVIVKTYKTIKPKKFRLKGELGLKDAATTGSTVGKIYAVTGTLGLTNVSIAARFDQEIVKGKLYVAGKITIMKLMAPVISLGVQVLRSEAKRRNTTIFKLIKSLIKEAVGSQ